MSYLKIILAIFVLLCTVACDNHPDGKAASQTKNAAKQGVEAIEYTCPMHHQIRSNKPGKCPICGMTLVPLEKNKADMNPMNGMHPRDTTAQIMLQPREQLLADIHTDTARPVSLAGQVVLTGTTIFDPRRQDIVSAWVSGWIEKMYVRNPGEKLSAGQKLYELYSPDLLSAEKDYLLALKQKDLFKQASVNFSTTLDAMKQKLLRWGLTGTQIKQLSQDRPAEKVTIYSKTSGYVTQKIKEEGDHVNEGDAVLSLAGNKTIWVQAQLYDNELPLLKKNPQIWVELDGDPAQRLPGKVVFNNPANQSDSRVHLLNIAIANPDGKIQPGMLAYVFLQDSVDTPVLAVPKSSVIYDEKKNYVWVALPNNHFQRHTVQLGADNDNAVQILKGIEPGDAVVSSGAYLINSEYILKYGSGVNMAGMTMSDMKMEGKGR